MKKSWKQTRRTATLERGPAIGETLLARLLRGLRSNPHGIEGPVVIQFVSTALAKNERGWGPNSPREVPEHELVEWTRAILIFLMSMSIDLRETEPDVSADATWALDQVELTAEQVRVAQGPELSRLARRVWAD